MNDWLEAEQHAERARRHFEAGEWQHALTWLTQALAVVPEQSDWLRGLGLTLDALQRYPEAIEAYRRALALQEEEDPETVELLGIDLVRVGEYAEGIRTLEQVTRLNPEASAAYTYRIRAYTRMGDYEQAELMFYLGQQVRPEDALAFDLLAEMLALRGHFDRALWCWQHSLELEPNFPGLSVKMARVHLQRGQTRRARRLYLDHLREHPGDKDALCELGALLSQTGRLTEAAEKYRRALELDPQRALPVIRLAELALRQGHLDAATARFKRALQLAPQRPGIHLGLAQVAWHRGEDLQALRLLREELARPGQSQRQVVEIARLMVELQHPAEAIALLEPMLTDWEQAAEHQRGLVASALAVRGVAHLAMNAPRAGITDCRRALRLQPGHPGTLRHLALAYLDLGRLRRSAVFLRHFEAMAPRSEESGELRRRMRLARWLAAWRRMRKRLWGTSRS